MFKNRSFLIKVVKDTPEGSKEVEVVNVVKSHFERHRTTYLIAAGIGVAGITWYITRSKPRPMWGGVEPMPIVGSANTASPFSFLLRSPQTINITTVLDRTGRGHPGWPVQNLETKQVFFSQKQAADAFGISEGFLTGHLQGKYPNANGLHFQRINLGV